MVSHSQWNSTNLPLYAAKFVVFGLGGSFGVVSPGEKHGDEPELQLFKKNLSLLNASVELNWR